MTELDDFCYICHHFHSSPQISMLKILTSGRMWWGLEKPEPLYPITVFCCPLTVYQNLASKSQKENCCCPYRSSTLSVKILGINFLMASGVLSNKSWETTFPSSFGACGHVPGPMMDSVITFSSLSLNPGRLQKERFWLVDARSEVISLFIKQIKWVQTS